MNLETFNALMKKEGWELEAESTAEYYKHGMSDQPMDFSVPSKPYIKGNVIIHIADKDICELVESNFDEFLSKHLVGFHFFDDWKKKFVGSEFLIPIVEKELLVREQLLVSRFHSRLFGIKEGFFNLEESIQHYNERMETINAQIKNEQK